jgi:hypothetical protein
MATFGLTIRRPIAYMVYPAEWEEHEIREFYRRFADGLRSGAIRGEVWDLTHLNPLFGNASRRKVAAECVKSITPLQPGVVMAAGRVVPSRVIRGLVTAVDWLTGQYQHPVENFSHHVEAEQFVIDKLRAARIDVPDTARLNTAGGRRSVSAAY